MDLNLRGRGLGIIELEDFVRGLLEFIPSFVGGTAEPTSGTKCCILFLFLFRFSLSYL